MIKIVGYFIIIALASLFFYNLGFSNAQLFIEPEIKQMSEEVPFYGYYDNFSEDIVVKAKELDTYQTFYVMMHEGFHKFYDDKYDIDLVSTDPRNEELAAKVLEGFNCFYKGTDPDLIEYYYQICAVGGLYE